MYRHNQIPILIFHVLEADIPQNTSIVDQHIYPSKVIDSSLNNSVAILDAVVVRNGLATFRLDFFDDDIGSLYRE